MTEIILALAVSIISIGMFIFIGFQINKFLKYFLPIVQEIINERKQT